MDQNTHSHISDDFLKKLVSLQQEEKLPQDFTQKVMGALPAIEAVPAEAKKKINIRLVAVIGVIGAAAIFLLFNIDFSGILRAASETSQNNPIKYIDLVTSITQAFSDGFSGFRITSITITTIASLATLHFADKFLKRYFDGRVEAV